MTTNQGEKLSKVPQWLQKIVARRTDDRRLVACPGVTPMRANVSDDEVDKLVSATRLALELPKFLEEISGLNVGNDLEEEGERVLQKATELRALLGLPTAIEEEAAEKRTQCIAEALQNYREGRPHNAMVYEFLAMECQRFGWYAVIPAGAVGVRPCNRGTKGAEPDLNRIAYFLQTGEDAFYIWQAQMKQTGG